MPALTASGGVVATFRFSRFSICSAKVGPTWRQFCSSTSRVVGYEYELPSGSVAYRAIPAGLPVLSRLKPYNKL